MSKAPIKPFRPVAKRPCAECPFRKKAPAGWLGAASPEEFASSLWHEDPLPCHSTIDYEDPAWHALWIQRRIGNLCRGALEMAAKSGKLARDQVAQPRVIPSSAVFDRLRDFLDHHNAAPVKSWLFGKDDDE